MSVQRGDDGGRSYSDHDVHHVLHQYGFSSGADAGPSAEDEDIQQFEITERGLDPDELAELVGMRVQYGIFFSGDEPQDSRSAIQASFGAGFNLSGDEFLLVDPDVTTVDIDDSGTDDFTRVTKDTDEVGQLWMARVTGSLGFDDDTNGNGAGAFTNEHAEFMNMRDMFGSGPYVDAADDFSSRVNIKVENAIDGAAGYAHYSLYYDVDEVEGGRTRFGR